MRVIYVKFMKIDVYMNIDEIVVIGSYMFIYVIVVNYIVLCEILIILLI